MDKMTSSYYGQNFPIGFFNYESQDYSKFAVIFPGQGSAEPGMFCHHLKKMPLLQKYLKIADDWAIGKNLDPISWYITQPNKIKSEQMLCIQNVALYSLEVALFETLLQKNKVPELITAHSFGEYAALVCAAVVNFEDMLEIVYQREVFTANKFELGTMLAVVISFEEWQKHTPDFSLHLANINSPKQLVFSLKNEDLAVAKQYFKKHKIAYKVLTTVARPYHCELMQDSAKELTAWLGKKEFKLQPFKFNFLSSVDGGLYRKNSSLSLEQFKDILSYQLLNPVHFVNQAHKMNDLAIYSYLELGVSGIYSNFLKQLYQENEDLYSFQNFDQLSFFESREAEANSFSVELEKHPFFKVLSKYISQVTGYEVVEIGINDYFQEDLRIDSIKKAEIVFKTLQETHLQVEESLTLAQLKRVGDVVKYLEQKKDSPFLKNKSKKQESDFFQTFKFEIEKANITPTFKSNDIAIKMFDIFKISESADSDIHNFLASAKNEYKNIVFTALGQITTFDQEQFHRLCQLIQKSFLEYQQLNKDTLITFVYNFKNRFTQPYIPFFKSIAIEYGLRFKSVFLKETELTDILLRKEYADEYTLDIEYYHGQRFAHTLNPFNFEQTSKNLEKVELYKNILVIGGAKGLAFEILQNSKVLKEAQFTILGRTSESDEGVATNLKKLRKKIKHINYYQADASQLAEFSSALLFAQTKVGNIDLVINAAGLELSQKLANKVSGDIERELNAKVKITENIIALKMSCPVIHFSSIVGLYGNEGQSIYAFANGFQKATSEELSQHASILWPAIEQTGMTNNIGLYKKMKATGISFLRPEHAAYLFDQIILNLTTVQSFSNILVSNLKDLNLFEYQSHRQDLNEAVYGQLVDPTQLIYQKKTNLSIDTFLRDHRIENTAVYPASLAIAKLFQYGLMFFKQNIQIDQFEIKNMMMVLEGRDNFSFNQFLHHMDNLDQVIKMSSNTQLEHFSGSVKIAKNLDFVQKILPQCRLQQRVNLETFYSKECIDFGPKFQVLENLYYIHEEQYSDLKNTVRAIGRGLKKPNYIFGSNFVDSLISILEGSFQTASLIGVVEGKRLAIPLKIKTIYFHSFDWGQCFYVPQIKKFNRDDIDSSIVTDVLVYNQNRELVMHIEELEMSTIRLHPDLPFKWHKENQVYEV